MICFTPSCYYDKRIKYYQACHHATGLYFRSTVYDPSRALCTSDIIARCCFHLCHNCMSQRSSACINQIEPEEKFRLVRLAAVLVRAFTNLLCLVLVNYALGGLMRSQCKSSSAETLLTTCTRPCSDLPCSAYTPMTCWRCCHAASCRSTYSLRVPTAWDGWNSLLRAILCLQGYGRADRHATAAGD